MGKFTYSDGVAVWKLVYYAPCLVASVYVASRHGSMKSSGWIFLTIFTVLRIVGAASQLATITSKSDTPYTIAAITSSIGLSPLLLASLGLLSRAIFSILKQPWNMLFSFVIMKAIQVPAAIGLILCIVGATSAKTPAQIDSETTVHIGIILFAVVLLALIVVDMGAALGWRMTRRGEGLIIAAVALALPFLITRILYSLLAVFSHDARFNIVTGNNTINLFMAVLTEAIVVLIYLICGLKLMAIPESEQTGSASKTLGYRFQRGDFGTGKLGILSLGAAVAQAINGKKDQNEKVQGQGYQQNGTQYAPRSQNGAPQSHRAQGYSAHPHTSRV